MDKKNNTTLMIHRTKKGNDVHKGKWNGLGGKFESNESPEECIIREINEESGLIIKSPKLHGFITFPLFDGKEDWYVFVFTAEEFAGKMKSSDEGELKWISNEKIVELNLWDGDSIFINWIKENKFFSAKFVYSNGKLADYSVNFY
jgi:8-oxo-dGTP diphosphatase